MTPVLAAASVACTGGHASTETVQPAIKDAVVSLGFPDPALAEAEAKLTAKCMRHAGFQYPRDGLSVRGKGSLFGMAGKLSLQEAQARGYGREIQRTPHGQDVPDPVSEYLTTLSASDRHRFFATLVGPQSAYVRVKGLDGRVVEVPTQGCSATARNAVYGSVENFVSLARFPAYLFHYSDQIYADPRFKSAQTAYASCMKSAGYDVRGPGEARDLAQARFGVSPTVVGRNRVVTPSSPPTAAPSSSPNGTVSDEERAMAVTDATCQQSSGVYAAWDEAGFAAASSWINDHEGQILALEELQQKSIARAEKILAGG